MIATDEDALICDLMETYGVAGYRSCRPSFIGTLASGLRGDSRIIMRLSGAKISTDSFLMAYCADRLANLAWMFSKDGEQGMNPPESMLARLLGEKQEEDSWGFESYDELEQELKQFEG